MHELGLAQELVEQLEQIARREGARQVVLVRLEMGAMCGVDRDAFEFAFPEAARGSLVEGAALEITEIPVCVRCRSCGKESAPQYPAFHCEACGSFDVDIISGRDFRMLSMEVN